jgi:hypothetical protein
MTDSKYFSYQIMVLLIILISGILSMSCERKDSAVAKNQDLDPNIEKTILSSITWAKTKDIQLLYRVIANDSNYLEVQPSRKVVKGFNEFTKGEKFWMHPDFKAIKVEIRDLHINISKSGTVAWWYCELDDINEWKGQPANWENTRWTGVLEKRDDKWVIVQMHFSFASE